jgi:uncharacterized protein (DUF488 family)
VGPVSSKLARLTPIFRKRGFSKRSLAEYLESAGIRYEHLRALGNPKDNCAGFAGDADELRSALARYDTLLADEEATAALDRVTELATRNRVAVLCFEASDHRCHRQAALSRVDDQLREIHPFGAIPQCRRRRWRTT